MAPGSHGGATHVMEVAGELSKLGHELHVVCRREKGTPARLTLPVEGGQPLRLYRLRLPQYLNLLSYPWLRRLAQRLQPDVIMERYYNLTGAGLIFAHRHHLPTLLEVNALMVDPPGTPKYRLDHRLGRPFERWATSQCRWAARIVTPLQTTVPVSIDRTKIAELPWGANIDRFDPARLAVEEIAQLRQKLAIPAAARVALFAGSFRHWHGVETLVEAARLLAPQNPNFYFVLLGGGPEEAAIRAKVATAGLNGRVLLTGPVPHDRMPLYLSLGDVGVAPFDTSKHPPLRAAGFFWSPLKIFEYMAMGLPTVTVDLPPLNSIVRPGLEGSLFQEGDPTDLARVLGEMLRAEPEKLKQMGQSARQRVSQNFSWAAHCRSLDQLLRDMSAKKAGPVTSQ